MLLSALSHPDCPTVFETVVPRSSGALSRHLKSLPASIAAHAILVGAAGLMMLYTVEFPTETPHITVAYVLLSPPPPPPPPPPAAAKSVPQNTNPIRMPDNVAPTIIPDTIPVVEPEPSVGVVEGITEGVVGGVVGGDPNGVAGGVIGGVVGGVAGGIVSDNAEPDTVVIPRDEPLPMASRSQTFPVYPPEARRSGWEDRVIVRYTIGKDGRVRLVEILSKPEREIFARETLRAIRTWRFRPMVVDGEAKEVVHELTVNYELEWLTRAHAAGKKGG